jgi:hypothetical protein
MPKNEETTRLEIRDTNRSTHKGGNMKDAAIVNATFLNLKAFKRGKSLRLPIPSSRGLVVIRQTRSAQEWVNYVLVFH